MECQETINLFDNKPNQPSKFRIKNWVEMSDNLWRTYNTDSPSEFKTWMLKSSLCDFSDAYILAKGTIAIPNTIFTTPGRIMLIKR